MKKLLFLIVLIFIGIFLYKSSLFEMLTITGAPPYDPSTFDNVPESEEEALIRDWKRPEGAAKVALQVGHWKSSEVPDELDKLRNNTGASGGGKSEWEVNMSIAEATKELLEGRGVVVELLPATIPPTYWADVFVSIHADGNLDSNKSGFKAAAPRRDYTGKASKLLTVIEETYRKATNLDIDSNVTRNMRGYYAFSWWRYKHAVHPMTTSLILETGFLTSPSDRRLIIDQPEVAAEGIADGIITFLIEENLLQG